MKASGVGMRGERREERVRGNGQEGHGSEGAKLSRGASSSAGAMKVAHVASERI